MKRGSSGYSDERDSTGPGVRGTSEIVGIILLFGMVLAGAAIVFAAGGTLVDSLQTEAESNQVQLEFESASTQIHDSLLSDDPRTVPDTNADRTLREDTTAVSFTRINQSSGWEGDTHTESINALVYEDQNGEQYVFEGGGQWRVSGDTVLVHSPPQFDIQFDDTGNSLRIDLVDIDADSTVGDGQLVAQPATENTVDEEALMDAMASGDPDNSDRGNDVRITIEGEYIEAWERYLRSTDDLNPNHPRVTVDWPDASSDEIVIEIKDLAQEKWSALDIVDVDADGYAAKTGGDSFEVDVTVENPDDATMTHSDGTVTLDINPEYEADVSDLDPGESETVSFTVPLDDVIDDKDPNEYEELDYEISTEDDQTDGTFLPLIRHDQSFYRIDGLEDEHNEAATAQEVKLTTTNIGGSDDEAEVTISLDSDLDEISNVDMTPEDNELSADPWGESEVSFEFNRSALPAGNYTYTVEVDNMPTAPCNEAPDACVRTGTFTIDDDEGAVGDVGEIIVQDPADVEVSVIGTEISAEGDYSPTYTWWGTEYLNNPYDLSSAVLRVSDGHRSDGTMQQTENGQYEFNFVHDDTGDRAESDDGGWTFTANGVEWSDDGGYILSWEESENGDYAWAGPGTPEVIEIERIKQWAPVTAMANVGDERIRLTPQASNGMDIDDANNYDIEEHNLNTYGTQETVWDYEGEVQEGSVSITATYWGCDEYELAGVDTHDTYDDGNEDGYAHIECVDFDASTAISAEGGSGDATSESGFVMTRDESRAELPDIEKGYPLQRSIQEVFEDGTDDIDLEDGELTLGQNDFAFMMEVTMDQDELIEAYGNEYDGQYDLWTNDQTELNLAAWDVAQDYRDTNENTNDPNFNDVIGFVQVDPGETTLVLENAREGFAVDGESREPDEPQTTEIETPEDGADIEVGIGEIHLS